MASAPLTPDAIELARLHPAGWGTLVSKGAWVFAAHVALILDALLDAVRDGTGVLLTAPPRHGKSQSVARVFPGWYLGLWPDKRVAVASHTATLAKIHGRQARRDFEGFGASVFGHQVDPKSHAADRWEIAGHSGGYRAVGIGSSFTGEGANLLVVDDYCANAEAALSKLQRDAVWDWWETVASTRLEPGAAKVVMATRWHEADLIGQLLDREPGKWRLIRLPALAEDADPLGRSRGDALWPQQWPREALEGVRATKGSFWWSAMFQGSPTPEGGGIFKKAWWDDRRYRVDAAGVYTFPDGYRCPRDSMTRFGVVDLAVSEKTSADYTAVGAFGVTPDRRLVVFEVMRERTDDALPHLKRVVADWGLGAMWEEDEGTLLLEIRRHRKAGLPVRTFSKSKADTSLRLPNDKVATYHAAAPFVESKRLCLPREGVSWLTDFEAEITRVPAVAHDDQADLLAVACLIADSMALSAGPSAGTKASGRREGTPIGDGALPSPF